MGLEESGKAAGENSTAKVVQQAGAAGEAGTRESGRSRAAVLVLLALSFALGCTEFTIIGIESDIATSLGVELSLVGNLVGYFAVAYAVCTPLLAVFTGRFRRFQLMCIYLLVFNLGNLTTMLAPAFANAV